MDLIYKNTSPETYACSRCGLTFTNTGMSMQGEQAVCSMPHYKHGFCTMMRSRKPVMALIDLVSVRAAERI